VGYDSVGRITSFDVAGNSSNTAGFGYDANGNRSSSTRVVNGLSTSRSYTVGANNNRLTGFSQTTGGATTSVVYGYNANGDLTGDGLRSYGYDAEGRLSTATTGATDSSPTTRYAHNALGQRVFKTEPLYPPSQGDESDPGFWGNLVAFFTKMWSPATSQAEQLGYAYVYDERGTLVAEIGSGGTNSAGQASYIYLPTANGPMPVAAVINGNTYAIHSDHLNTPRRLSNEASQPVWQWRYSAFGEEEPTMAAKRFTGPETLPITGTTSATPVAFNLRYPGQYADAESGLFYNGFRTYISTVGRYTQGDPIGLSGGWNRFGYAYQAPLSYTDPTGLLVPLVIPGICAAGGCEAAGAALAAGAIWWANHNSANISAPMLSVPKGDTDPLKDEEHAAYHAICDQPPPPNLDKCEFMRWKISQLKRCIAARSDWESKYGPTAGHSDQISQKVKELAKWERRYSNAWDCKKDCP